MRSKTRRAARAFMLYSTRKRGGRCVVCEDWRGADGGYAYCRACLDYRGETIRVTDTRRRYVRKPALVTAPRTERTPEELAEVRRAIGLCPCGCTNPGACQRVTP